MKTMKNMKQSRFILFVLSFLVTSVGNVYAQSVTVTGTVQTVPVSLSSVLM